MDMTVSRVEFPGHSGATLAARLDMPNGPVRAHALLAHCFTCSKDLLAVRRIAASLEPFEFDRLYGAFGRHILSDAKGAVRRSVERTLRFVEA